MERIDYLTIVHGGNLLRTMEALGKDTDYIHARSSSDSVQWVPDRHGGFSLLDGEAFLGEMGRPWSNPDPNVAYNGEVRTFETYDLGGRIPNEGDLAPENDGKTFYWTNHRITPEDNVEFNELLKRLNLPALQITE